MPWKRDNNTKNEVLQQLCADVLLGASVQAVLCLARNRAASRRFGRAVNHASDDRRDLCTGEL